MLLRFNRLPEAGEGVRLQAGPGTWGTSPRKAAICYNVVLSMTKYIGEFEQAILLAILRLGEEAYGLAIRQELEACTDRQVTHGAAYVTLDRLEAKGLLESRLGDSAPGRGGRRKRYFQLSPAGLEALRSSRKALMRLWSGLEEVLEEPR